MVRPGRQDIRVVDGDIDQVAFGLGTMGSRSMVKAVAAALYRAALDKIIEKASKIAAHILEAGESDLEFQSGNFSVAGTDKTVSLKDVAKASFLPPKLPPDTAPGLFETGTFSPKANTFPTAAIQAGGGN